MSQLHVEVCLKDAEAYVSRTEIEAEVYRFLKEDHRIPVNIGEHLDPAKIKFATHIESILVSGVDILTKNYNSSFEFSKVQLKVHAYEPWGQEETSSNAFIFQASTNAQAKITNLPHRTLMGVWECLEFDEGQNIDPEQILNSVVRTLSLLCRAQGFPNAMNINRLILFYGPPGCGKSTLCRALAHKLTIRLGHMFGSGKLFEINTQNLLSKYYSESGKLVSEMFDKVLSLAQDEKQLICVLIDEIESIASSRQHSTQSGECSDTVRATNQLLTALDRIRSKPNIIVLCTSNLLESIDAAFIDRLYDAIPVPPPCAGAVYTILSNTLNSLIDVGAIKYEPWVLQQDHLGIDELVGCRARFPNYAQLHVWEAFYPESPGAQLGDIAQDCCGLSGRKLRKLPFLAITKYTWDEQCSVMDAVSALRTAVKNELAA